MRGIAWHDAKEHEKAVQYLNKSIRLGPDNALSWHAGGTAWGGMYEHDKAFADFDESVRLCPEFVDAWSKRGYALIAKGDFDKAVESFGNTPIFSGGRNGNFFVHRLLEFYGRRDASNCHAVPSIIVCPSHCSARCRTFSILRNSFISRYLLARSPVEGLRIRILLRLAGLDILQTNAVLAHPRMHRAVDKLPTIVKANRLWPAVPFNQPIQSAQNTRRRQGKINLDANTLAGMIINHTKHSERANALRLIPRGVSRSRQVRTFRNRQLIQLRTLQAATRLD